MTTSKAVAQALVRAYLHGRSMEAWMFDAVVDMVARRLTSGKVPVLSQMVRTDIDNQARAVMAPQQHSEPAYHVAEAHRAAAAAPAPTKIYLIDDHPLMREALAMMVRKLYPHRQIVELGCLAELLPSVDAFGPPALILLDLNLPDATGCAGVDEVRQHFPDALLAVYSASRAADMAQHCLRAGADLYIEKTTGSSELFAALRGLLIDFPLPTPHMARDAQPSGREQAA